jgi:hypothetical protein
VTRLPNSPHTGKTPRQIAHADRRALAVKNAVDRLLIATPIPPTEDRTEAVIKLATDDVIDAAIAVLGDVGGSLDDVDVVIAGIAGELLLRHLERGRPS